MAVTVRDLKLATSYKSDLQLASEALRRTALVNHSQLQAVSEALRHVALGNQGQLQAVSEAMFTVAGQAARSRLRNAAQERALPQQGLPSDSAPIQHPRLPIAQLFLHATFTVLVAFLIIAYMEAKLANEPEESLLNLLFAIWF